jgi:hypothetical protein
MKTAAITPKIPQISIVAEARRWRSRGVGDEATSWRRI